MEFKYFAVAIVILVAVIGTVITTKGIKSDYYQSLVLSDIQPPSIVFSLVWTFIYASYAYVWYKNSSNLYLNVLFAINMALNLLWVYLFFGPNANSNTLKLSRLVILMLLAVVISQIVFISQLNSNVPKTFSYISLGAYALWLVIATYLNFSAHEE